LVRVPSSSFSQIIKSQCSSASSWRTCVLRAKDKLTKRYFAQSVGMNVAHIFDANGNLVEFQRLVKMAEQSASVQSAPAHQEETVAAATVRPDFEKKQPVTPQQRNGRPFYRKPKHFKPYQSQFRGREYQDMHENPKSICCQLCNGSGHGARDCSLSKAQDT